MTVSPETLLRQVREQIQQEVDRIINHTEYLQRRFGLERALAICDAALAAAEQRQKVGQRSSDIRREQSPSGGGPQWPSEQQIDGLRQFVQWHGAAHEIDCPSDDTCACACKPLNDAVNGILSESFDRAVIRLAPARSGEEPQTDDVEQLASRCAGRVPDSGRVECVRNVEERQTEVTAAPVAPMMSAADFRLSEIMALSNNWDSYGAAPITPAVVENARLFLERVNIMPGSDGSVQLEWHTHGLDLAVLCHADGMTSVRVAPVAPSSQITSDQLRAIRQADLPMIRYGIRWNGPHEPIATPMPDGYWTPWHLASAHREPPAGETRHAESTNNAVKFTEADRLRAARIITEGSSDPRQVAPPSGARPICANPADCCRELSRVWAALGIERYTGKSASEHVAELRNAALPAPPKADQ